MATLATVIRASSLGRRFESLPFAMGEIPRGALTEIAGPASSGRTAFLHALLAAASLSQEFCALIDAEDAFDPASAAATGVCLSQVLWVRCGGNAEHALKAADLLAHAGGFGLVALDLADTPARIVRRIPMAAWFRLRHGIENTKTALVSIGQQIHARSCSALKIELHRERTLWRGARCGAVSEEPAPARLLRGVDVAGQRIQNHRADQERFTFWR